MYAVVKTSGRQYRVQPGDSFSVEKIEGAPGSTVDIKEVLMIGGDQTVFGTPYVSGATVTAVIEQQYRGPKILVFKKKRRHKYRNMRGHRSELTKLFISAITTSHGSVKAETQAHVVEVGHEKKTAKKAKVKTAGDETQHASTKKAKKPAGAKKSAAGKAKSKK